MFTCIQIQTMQSKTLTYEHKRPAIQKLPITLIVTFRKVSYGNSWLATFLTGLQIWTWHADLTFNQKPHLQIPTLHADSTLTQNHHFISAPHHGNMIHRSKVWLEPKASSPFPLGLATTADACAIVFWWKDKVVTCWVDQSCDCCASMFWK